MARDVILFFFNTFWSFTTTRKYINYGIISVIPKVFVG